MDIMVKNALTGVKEISINSSIVYGILFRCTAANTHLGL